MRFVPVLGRIFVASVFTVALSVNVLSLSERCETLAADSGEISDSIRSVLRERLTDRYFDPAAEFHSELKKLKANIEVGVQEDCGPLLSTMYNNIGCVYYLQGQHMHMDAVNSLNNAVSISPANVISWKNLAWLKHAVTVDNEKSKELYEKVWGIVWLRQVVDMVVRERVVSYERVRKLVLPYMGVALFQETNISGGVSKSLGADNERLFILDRRFDVHFIHNGDGGVQLELLSDDCPNILDSDYSCHFFFQSLLSERKDDLLIFEMGLNGVSCLDPTNPTSSAIPAIAKHYLYMVKMQLIGFYDLSNRKRLAIEDRLKWLQGTQRYTLSLSSISLNDVNTTHYLDDLPGHTQASFGMLNNVYLLMEDLMLRKGTQGSFLEAGVWRGGVTMYMKAALDVLQSISNPDGGIPRRVFVADSFMGVPPARNTSAFQMDEWHLNAQNLYAVQYDTVRASFEELGLLGNSNENNPEKEGTVQFIKGFFNESLAQDWVKKEPLAMLRVDADSYESVRDVLYHLYDSVVPGGVVIIDDWHLNGARMAVLEFRLERGILEPMIPVPEDFVYSCRQSRGSYYTFPNKPVQGTYWIKRPHREKTFAAAGYYTPYTSDVSTALSYGVADERKVCGTLLKEYTEERTMAVPPREIPDALKDRYLMGGKAKLENFYVDDTVGGEGTHYHFDRSEIDHMVSAAKAQLHGGKSNGNFLERMMGHALLSEDLTGATIAVFGSSNPWYEAMGLGAGAKQVVTIEYNQLHYDHPDIFTTTPRNVLSLVPGKNGGFDAAFSISSFDHSGLGRYGDPVDPDGDLKAMQTAFCMLKPGGLLFLAVPVGPDCVAWNLHRVYGGHRLPKLLAGFEVVSRHGWDAKKYLATSGNYRKSYEPVFVLRKPLDGLPHSQDQPWLQGKEEL